MDRRNALRALAGLASLPFLPQSAQAASVLGESLHAQLLQQGTLFRTLSAAQQRLVSRLADRILPPTDTPGALDVRVPEFIDLLLTEQYKDDDRQRFLAGLADIDARATALAGRAFVELAEAQQLDLMRTLDGARRDKTGAGHAFGAIKSMTIYGYFTSERVTKEVLRTKTFHMRYDGCAPFTA